MERYTVTEVCLLAGKLMLQSGAETYRVEDTMIRIAQSYGMDGAQAHATPTAIMFATDVTEPTNFVRIVSRETDLHKVTQVNGVSRAISSGHLDVTDAAKALITIDEQKDTYPNEIQLLAAAFASGCFTIMFDGAWVDFLPAFFVGALGYGLMSYFHDMIKIRFFAEFLAASFVGLFAYLIIFLNLGQEIDKIIIGAIMPLVPGLLITNAVRDLMAGHLVSGITKGAEAFLTAAAIGAGIAVIFFIF